MAKHRPPEPREWQILLMLQPKGSRACKQPRGKRTKAGLGRSQEKAGKEGPDASKGAGMIQDGDGLCFNAAGSCRGHLFLSKWWLLSQAPIRIMMLITTGKGCVERG